MDPPALVPLRFWPDGDTDWESRDSRRLRDVAGGSGAGRVAGPSAAGQNSVSGGDNGGARVARPKVVYATTPRVTRITRARAHLRRVAVVRPLYDKSDALVQSRRRKTLNPRYELPPVGGHSQRSQHELLHVQWVRLNAPEVVVAKNESDVVLVSDATGATSITGDGSDVH